MVTNLIFCFVLALLFVYCFGLDPIAPVSSAVHLLCGSQCPRGLHQTRIYCYRSPTSSSGTNSVMSSKSSQPWAMGTKQTF
uniref:Putative secreted peptide n=1 Tax=Anopheles braziliensis TaxID=58242 RepID=A0A2M3ZQ55_9DIPT